MCAILTAAFFGMSRNSDLLPTPPPPSSRGLHFAKAGIVIDNLLFHQVYFEPYSCMFIRACDHSLSFRECGET